MKSKTISSLVLASTVLAGAAFASGDYAPAIWNPVCSGHWYTSGYGHKFCVCHDMEGYYLSSISYLRACSTSASIHYCVNGVQDTSTDAPAGEISQLVAEANYAWHAKCWNQYSFGTEHEGFVSNPAWFTTAMYSASGALQKHLCEVWGIAKDRNHIVGHDEKKNAAWCTYAEANFGIDAHCNSHTDPGQYWDWNTLMSYVNPSVTTIIVDNADAGFSASANWSTGSSATDKYGADYRYRSTAALSDQAVFTGNLPAAGTYTVYVWYPQGANRSTQTPFIISTSGGTTTQIVNQQITGGQWVNQGAYSMNAGNNTVKVSCWVPTGFVVVADAVKWVK